MPGDMVAVALCSRCQLPVEDRALRCAHCNAPFEGPNKIARLPVEVETRPAGFRLTVGTKAPDPKD